MVLLLAVVFVLAFLITLNAVPRMMRVAWKTGLVDRPGPRKIHAEPVPYGGGVAVAAGVLIPLVLGVAAAAAHLHLGMPVPEGFQQDIPRVVDKIPKLLLLIGAATTMLLLGLVDDRHGLGVWTKLLVQTLVATAMAVGYERLALFSPATPMGEITSGVVTVLWIVAVTNAFNLLDHMDGLCSGVVVVAGGCFLAVAVLTGQWLIAAFLSAILASCAAFLLFNFPPAKVFLGDAGSLFIGFLLSALTVSFTFYEESYPFYSYAVPILILSVPLFDTASVVALRLRERRSPFDADTNHFAHRLMALGLARRSTVATIYALTLVTGIPAVLLYRVGQVGAYLILGQIAAIFAIIAVLESWGRARQRKERDG